MKTITIKQPWAQIIVEGIKDVENRSWKTNFRGKVLIHASQKIVYYKNLSLVQLEYLKQNNPQLLKSILDKSFITSAIIGEVEIIDCVKNSTSIWAEHDQWHWILSNAKMYDEPIVNVKGKLSFWNYNI